MTFTGSFTKVYFKDGKLDSVYLGEEQEVQGIKFPAGTFLFFDSHGKIQAAKKYGRELKIDRELKAA